MNRRCRRSRGSRLLIMVFSLLLLATVLPRGGFARVFDPEVFTLENGLQVVVIPNRRAPIVTHTTN